jgi:hypothetical protein
MEKTRTPVGAAGWLWVNLAVAAMGFSLVHTLVDFAVIALGSRFGVFGVQQSLLSVLIGLLYTWWAWVFAKAVGGTKSWLVGLMVFDVLWVGGNGLTILACLPPCGSVPFFADALHVGNLILAPLATYFAYRAMRRISVPGRWLVMVGNIIIMLAFVIAIVAVLASLSNA